jgi:hypothetical protein
MDEPVVNNNQMLGVPRVRDEKGRIVKGSPLAGRKLGVTNKFTTFRLEIMDIWKKAGGAKRLLKMLESEDISEFKWAAERVISVLPRQESDRLLQNEGAQIVINYINNPPQPDKRVTIDVG